MTPLRAKSQSNKRTWNRVGITRYIKTDRRRAGNPKYVIFGVNYTDSTGKFKIKQFEAGRLGTIDWKVEMHAAQTADAFRSEYEWCRANALSFNTTRYSTWKTQILYPFSPQEVHEAEPDPDSVAPAP